MSEPLTTEWPDDPTDTEQAEQAVDELRLCINEVMQHHEGLGPYHGQELDYDHYHLKLAHLYIEWALEHMEQLNDERHSYAEQAESDLKNIIFRLD